MWYKNEKWEIVTNRYLTKKLKHEKTVRYKNKKFTYIGRTKESGNDIALVEWTILTEPSELDMVKVICLDMSKIRNPDRTEKTLDISLNILKLNNEL